MTTSIDSILVREEVKRAKLLQEEELARQQLWEQFRCHDSFFAELAKPSARVSSSLPRPSRGGSSALSILEEARFLRQAEQEARIKAQEQRYHEEIKRSKILLQRRANESKRSKSQTDKARELDVILLERDKAAAHNARCNFSAGALTPGPGIGDPSNQAARSGRVTTSPLRVHRIKHRNVIPQQEVAELQRQARADRRELIERRRLENLDRLRLMQAERRQQQDEHEKVVELQAQQKSEALLIKAIEDKRHHFEKLDELKARQHEAEHRKKRAAIASANEKSAKLLLANFSDDHVKSNGSDAHDQTSSVLLTPRRELELLQKREHEVRRGLLSSELWNVEFNAVSKKLEAEDRQRALEEKKRQGEEIRKKQVQNFSAVQDKRHLELQQLEEAYIEDMRQARAAAVKLEEDRRGLVRALKAQEKNAAMSVMVEEARKAREASEVQLVREKSVLAFQEMSNEIREQRRLKIRDAEVSHERRIRSLERQKLVKLQQAQEQQRLEMLELQQRVKEQQRQEEQRMQRAKALEEVREREKLNAQVYHKYVAEVKDVEISNSEAFYVAKLPDKRPRPFQQSTPTSQAMFPPVVPPHPEFRDFNFTSEALMRDIDAEISVADQRVRTLRQSMRT